MEVTIEELRTRIKQLEGKRVIDSPVDELQECYVELSKRQAGRKMVCVAERGDSPLLRKGDVYEFVAIEAGIFSTPYVTVRREDGRTVTGHAYRWEFVTE